VLTVEAVVNSAVNACPFASCQVGSTRYFEAAGFPGRTVGLREQAAPDLASGSVSRTALTALPRSMKPPPTLLALADEVIE
jgi:hypothetical protein